MLKTLGNLDTAAHLFIQASWNRADQILHFGVFGANTGRAVPVISDFKPVAAPSYTPDDRAALGRRRLLDSPMQGMTSVSQRTVKVGARWAARRSAPTPSRACISPGARCTA